MTHLSQKRFKVSMLLPQTSHHILVLTSQQSQLPRQHPTLGSLLSVSILSDHMRPWFPAHWKHKLVQEVMHTTYFPLVVSAKKSPCSGLQ